MLFKAAGRHLGLLAALTATVPDARAPGRVTDGVGDLVAQRVFAIACGHPDGNDADRLADDPIHKLLLGRDPIDGCRLASQPTISRVDHTAAPQLLLRSKRDETGMIAPPPGALTIHTSRALHDRAARIWQVLLTGFEGRGYPASISERATTVTVLGEPLTLSLHEGTKNVAHKITFTEQKAIDRGYGFRVATWDDVPSRRPHSHLKRGSIK